MLQDHGHIISQVTINVKTELSDKTKDGNTCVVIRTEKLGNKSTINQHSHISVKHKTKDEIKSLFFPTSS